MKNKKRVVVIRGDDFKVFYQPFVYASGLYYGNGRREPGKNKNHKTPDRRQKNKKKGVHK